MIYTLLILVIVVLLVKNRPKGFTFKRKKYEDWDTRIVKRFCWWPRSRTVTIDKKDYLEYAFLKEVYVYERLPSFGWWESLKWWEKLEDIPDDYLQYLE